MAQVAPRIYSSPSLAITLATCFMFFICYPKFASSAFAGASALISSPSTEASVSSSLPSSSSSELSDGDREVTSIPTPLTSMGAKSKIPPSASSSSSSSSSSTSGRDESINKITNSPGISSQNAIGLLGLARNRLQQLQQQQQQQFQQQLQQPNSNLPQTSPDTSPPHAVGPLSDLQSFLKFRHANGNSSLVPFRLESLNPDQLKLNHGANSTFDGNADHITDIMERVVKPHRNKQQQQQQQQQQSLNAASRLYNINNRLNPLVQQRATLRPQIDLSSEERDSPMTSVEQYFSKQPQSKTRLSFQSTLNGPPSHSFMTQPMGMVPSSPVSVTAAASESDSETEDAFDGGDSGGGGNIAGLHIPSTVGTNSGADVMSSPLTQQQPLPSPVPTSSSSVSHKNAASTNKPSRSHFHHGSKRIEEMKKLTQASWVEKNKPNNIIPLSTSSTAAPLNIPETISISNSNDRPSGSNDEDSVPPTREGTVVFDTPRRNSYPFEYGQGVYKHGHVPHRPVTCCKTYYPPPVPPPPPLMHAPIIPPFPYLGAGPLLPPPGIGYEPHFHPYPSPHLHVGASNEIDSDGQSKSSSSMAPTMSPSPSSSHASHSSSDSSELTSSYGHHSHDHIYPGGHVGESYCFQHPDPLLFHPLYLKHLKLQKLLFPLTWKKKLLLLG